MNIYIYIYIYILISLIYYSIVKGNPKGPFSVATTLRCWGGCYSFPWIAPLNPWYIPTTSFPGLLHFTLDTYLIKLSVKQGDIKYHVFESLVWLNLGLNLGLLGHCWTFYQVNGLLRKPGFSLRSSQTKDSKTWYLMPPCLTLSIIRSVSRVKWSNPGKEVVPSPTSRCSSYWKGILWVTLVYGRQLYYWVFNFVFFFFFFFKLSVGFFNCSFQVNAHSPFVISHCLNLLLYCSLPSSFLHSSVVTFSAVSVHDHNISQFFCVDEGQFFVHIFLSNFYFTSPIRLNNDSAIRVEMEFRLLS